MIMELKKGLRYRERSEERKKGRDEQILVLEEMIYLFEETMRGLKSAHEATEDENQKSKLTGGILVFEFVINLMRQKMELLGNEEME